MPMFPAGCLPYGRQGGYLLVMTMPPAHYLAYSISGVTLRLLPAAPYCARYTLAQPVAGFAFDTQEGVHAFASDRVRPFRATAGGLAFTPANCPVYSEASEGGEYLTVSGEAEALAALLPDAATPLPAERFSGRIGADGANAARRLRRLIVVGGANTAIEAALAGFLAAICRSGGASWQPLRGAGSLTPRRLRIVEDLIEARLGGPLSITEMAAACGLSAGFFLRTFRAATGQTPHRYLMDRRLARARRLLVESECPTAEIALATGFASQAHMTAAFTRTIGIAPAGYRKISSRRDSCVTIPR
jgi:AraC family transcriptional regulator